VKRFWRVGVLVAGLTSLAGPATAAGDAARGEKLFMGFLRCNNCHSLEPGVTKVGPTLAGLFGRKAGSAEGFTQYSEAMMNSDVVWNKENLNKFLTDPQKFIPGNKMIEGGYRVVGQVISDQHRADLIAYIVKATEQ
jgi:cytochrome c